MSNEYNHSSDTISSAQWALQSEERDRDMMPSNPHPAQALRHAQAHPASLRSREVRQLHGTIGNQGVQHLFRTTAAPTHIQAKLKTTTPGDQYEEEADRIADHVVRTSDVGEHQGETPAIRSAPPPISHSLSSTTIARQTDDSKKLIPVVTGEVVEGSMIPLEDIDTPTTVPPPLPAGGWGADYKKQESQIGESSDKYKSTIGKIQQRPALKAASAWKGRGKRVKTTITEDQLRRIIAPSEPAAADRIAPMLDQMNRAFEMMMIDTAQAQAAYIAHMAGETGGKLEEVGGEQMWYAPFQGRGPVQVTHEYNYVQTLVYMELRAEQLEKEGADKRARIAELERNGVAGSDRAAEITRITAEVIKADLQAAELRRAHAAIKGDQRKAADPEFAFLFSAAYMHMTRGVRASSWLGPTASFTGKGSEDFWVTGSNTQEGVLQKDGTRKNVSMTFEERRLYAVAHGYTKLAEHMESAKNRGAVKSAVYGRAVAILGKENAI